jgi:hypothetical protein
VNIFESIRAQLAATEAITAIVGTRIYHGERPQDSTLPALAFDENGDAESFQDIAGAPIGLARIGIRLECFAAASGVAHTLREACRDALLSWIQSPMGGAGGALVWCCDFVGQSAAYDPDVEIVAKYLDLELMYTET